MIEITNRGKKCFPSRDCSISKEKALRILTFVSEKKAIKPVILDVKDISTLCDYFVVCSGDTGRHVRSIYEGVIKQCQEKGIKIYHCEDDGIGRWIMVDLNDVVVHIFDNESREFYNLEHLWSAAKKLRLATKRKTSEGLV